MLRKTMMGPGRTIALLTGLCLAVLSPRVESAEFERRAVTQWYPFAEWRIENVTEGEATNPFDVVAWATFHHRDSGETIRTGMFYDGNGTWKFRFAGTKLGQWHFETASRDAAELDGWQGDVDVAPNKDSVLGRGFVTGRGNEWTWSGSGRAFVPQLVMGTSIDVYHAAPERIEPDLKRWYGEHGFNGLHTALAMRWFDIDRERLESGADTNPNPDPRTFAALERLIMASYQAGGMVHLWAWGDESRGMTPVGLLGGINGAADERLQRYIAARLGALPGWTMGYGFDLWEWVDVDQLVSWHSAMHQQLGWPHLLGGRMHRHGTPLEDLLTDRLDYIGFETHQPDLQIYTEALRLHPGKPVFMEDRFRVREPSPYPDKDYTPEMVRRGSWHSMMAGGVANIWGYMPGETGESEPFPNRQQIKTYATFHERYFKSNMVRDDERTGGTCLRRADERSWIFYAEDTATLRMDLRGVAGELRAVAVNTREPYEELEIGPVSGELVWQAPTAGDWAVAVTAQETPP